MPRWQSLSIRERLLFHASAETEGACWIWTARINASGYGICADGRPGRHQLAHRLAFQEFVGAIPDGLEVCHHCDTPACINPDHLFLGTHAENMADSKAKGRARGAPGIANSRCKLTEDDVRFIRSAGGSNMALARRFNVSHTLIRFIRQRRAWKHVA